ncbi:TPA: cytochrome b/b6 domain-containing protein [Aeromonas hydrophila]
MMKTSEWRKIRVWDLPVRLFHWALVLLMAMLFLSAYAGQMEAHGAIGRVVLVLVVFRLVWGFIGSQTSRFSDFVKGIGGIRAYLSSGKLETVGHNPLGALMVVAMLAVILIQAVSGMFSSDGLGFSGPLAHWISKVASDSIASFHVIMAYVIAILIASHVLAVLWHWIRHRENLIIPMFSGKKWVPLNTVQPLFASSALALVIVVLVAVLVVAATRGT